MKQLVDLFNSQGVLHIAGVAAVATLLGTGTLPTDVGFPLLAGLLGLGIGSATAAPKQ